MRGMVLAHLGLRPPSVAPTVLLVLAVFCGLSGADQTQAAEKHTRPELVFSHDEVRAGETLRVGVLLRMDPGWHTYWVNPGDAGGATMIEWELPKGVEAGPLEWPVPEVNDLEGILTYVYHDEVLLSAPLRIPPDFPAGRVTVKAKLEWLECAMICVPGDGEVTGSFEVGTATRLSAYSGTFGQYAAQLPRKGGPEGLEAHWQGPGTDDSRSLVIQWTGAGEQADFLALPEAAFEVGVATERLRGGEGEVRLRKEVRRWEGAWPGTIHGVLVERRLPEVLAYAVSLQVAQGNGQATETPAVAPRAGGEAEREESEPGLGWMLLFALLGGAILNAMPCVLPVIALKVLGFVQQAQHSPGKVRRHGLLYGLGVLVSFTVLAGAVILVQWGGRLASWGMQFQSPVFLVVMTTLVVLVALNLFGVFEIAVGGRALGAAAMLAAREGDAGAFFNGVLATTLATPCTAPFLGPAVGFAFAQPPWMILLFFWVIGVGLAAPYVAISYVPALGRWLPRPGPWMERFKVAMGFPMLGAGVWLLSLLARHYGTSGVLWMGLFLITVALAAWVYGQFGQRSTWGRGRAVALSGIVVGAGYFVALEGQLDWRTPLRQGVDKPSAIERAGMRWLPWSPEAVASARERGVPVFVDFTADWCAICQANKKTSIDIEAFREKVRDTGTVLFLADYTLRDDRMTAALRMHERAAVPLVLVYPRDPQAPPIILPELLTPSLVLEALDRAAARTRG